MPGRRAVLYTLHMPWSSVCFRVFLLPHIDALAATGVLLSNFYVQRACAPTRAALLTGWYNIRYGMQSGVLEAYNNYTISLSESLMPGMCARVRRRARARRRQVAPRVSAQIPVSARQQALIDRSASVPRGS